MPIKISNDATLSDIVSSLDNAKEYVRRVFGRMVEYRKDHGSAVLRLGTTGRGIAPHYRVQKEHSKTGEFLGYILEDQPGYFTAFHGRSHKKLEWGAQELHTEHWSTRAMTFDEVQSLLGTLRQVDRSKR